MSSGSEDLYETRTNLLSCDNMIEYFWRHCEQNSIPFKPENAVDVVTESVSSVRFFGSEITENYSISKEDINNANIKGKKEYNFDMCTFTTLTLDKVVASSGILALVYPADRSLYSLFLMKDVGNDQKELKLLLKVKQKVSLFGSFTNDMVTYFDK